MATTEELKERASSCLKRVSEISSGATKTAVIGLAALTIIWTSQIRPQYQQLLDDVYPAFKETKKSYVEIKEDTPKLKTLRLEVQSLLPNAKQNSVQDVNASKESASPSGDTPSSQSTTADKTPTAAVNRPGVARLQKEIMETKKEKSRDLKENSREFLNLVKGVSFEVFGFKASVAPLYASAVWNLILFILLLYLAQARSRVWALCADALFALKTLGRRADGLDDIAGSGPLWLAPSPSVRGKTDVVTTEDFRLAFGWNRLETLPSIAATAGFLLLSLLQLAVISQGYKVIKSGSEFTSSLNLAAVSESQVGSFDSSKLKLQIQQLASQLIKKAANSEQARTDALTAKELEDKLTDLTITPVEASLLSLFLLLTVIGTMVLVVRWFYPWRNPGRVVGQSTPPQRLAVILLGVLAMLSLFLIIGWRKPEWGFRLGDKLDQALPAVTNFLAASVTTYCLIELFVLAFLRKPVAPQIESDGKEHSGN